MFFATPRTRRFTQGSLRCMCGKCRFIDANCETCTNFHTRPSHESIFDNCFIIDLSSVKNYAIIIISHLTPDTGIWMDVMHPWANHALCWYVILKLLHQEIPSYLITQLGGRKWVIFFRAFSLMEFNYEKFPEFGFEITGQLAPFGGRRESVRDHNGPIGALCGDKSAFFATANSLLLTLFFNHLIHLRN